MAKEFLGDGWDVVLNVRVSPFEVGFAQAEEIDLVHYG